MSYAVILLPPSLQYDHHLPGKDSGGVSAMQVLVQAFKIAERSSPGFCDEFVLRTVEQLKR